MADRIFISYSHSDSAFVRWLREELIKRGYDVWFDTNSIQIGQIWRKEIVQGIEESDYFMVIISSRSVESANVVKELSLAESFGKIILPIMIDKVAVPANMKYQLAGVQFIVLDDNRSEENLDMLVESLRNQAIASGRDFVASLVLNRGYELGQLMGQSERSTTYRIKDQMRGRDSVLKIYPTSSSTVHAFRAEAKRLETLRHQGFPIILDQFEQQGCYCLIQEFIEGRPWGAIQWTSEMMTIQARKTLSLLSLMHQRGIVHADIRPNNLLLLPDTHDSCIIDLSLVQTALKSKLMSPAHTIRRKETESLQTVEKGFARGFFQAPEFTRFSVLTPAIDLYALGVTILVLSSGHDPDTLYEQKVGQWLMGDVDESMHRWLAPMLIDSPSERVQQAEQVIELMDAVSVVTLQSSQPETTQSKPAPLSLLGSLDADQDQQIIESLPISSLLTEQTVPDRQFSRNRLLACLLQHIGPVAENLLQPWAEDLDESDHEALRRSFAAIGIDLLILEECLSQAAMNGKDLAAQATATAAPIPPTAVEVPNPPPPPSRHASAVLEWLRYEVGPIADVLWDARLEESLRNTPDRARLKLEKAGMNADLIDKLLQWIGKTSAQADPSTLALTKSSAQAPELLLTQENDKTQNQLMAQAPESIQAQPLSEEQLKAILLDLIGPMAHSLMEEVASVPQVEERVKRLLERLSQLGISTKLIQTLHSRLKPWSGD